jgi:hypothetical protein
MAVEGVLTGWIELVSATQLIRLDEVKAALKKLADDNPSLEIVRLDAENDELSHADITCWDEPAPNFAALLRPLVDLLEEEEYLYFEEKVKFGHRGRTLRALLVSGVGVFKAEQDALILLLQERNNELSELNDDEEDESLGDNEEPIEDPESVM